MWRDEVTNSYQCTEIYANFFPGGGEAGSGLRDEIPC